MSQLAKQAAKSWSSTLRLPKSTFPPRPAPQDLANYLKRCTDDLYEWQSRQRATSTLFTLHDGPPYANGSLHVGHALNKILKDIVGRTKLAEGRRVSYIPGWDCHGLPIELKALEHHGWELGQKQDALAIRRVARSFAEDAVKTQMEGFKSWGIMADWAKHWKTMDKDFELRQLSVFRAMAKNGLIYRRHKPVFWSPSSRTALAEAELEYKDDHVSRAALVKFPIIPRVDQTPAQTTHVAIWTTTPWTLPANQAIAFNKNLSYSKVLSPRHGLLLVAKGRIPYLAEMLKEQLQVIEEDFAVEDLLSSQYQGPASFDPLSASRPFTHADFVSSETGTGFVHCAPGHGMEDYEALQPLIRTRRIQVKAPVDAFGHFTAEAAPVNPSLLLGKDIFADGNTSVLQQLATEGLLLAQHNYQHKFPYDWRTKKPIMIRATAQWFADISSIKSETLRALDDVKFHPETGLSRLKSFVENRSEWCISRQRAWGVPIPALFHKDTGEALLTDESVGHIIAVIDEKGIDAWWSDPSHDPSWVLPGISASDYIRGTDTMDVWFDSGTSWTAMLNEPEHSVGPLADMYLEGTDQHRGWFQSSLLTTVAYQKSVHPETPASAPFRSLVTHGFTLDGTGKKMSKSIGNVVSPDEILSGKIGDSKAVLATVAKAGKKLKGQNLPLGPDALRLWVASSDWTKDVVISDTIVKAVHSSLHKYRVTFKMLLGALQDYDPKDPVAISSMNKADQIALLHLYDVSATVRSTCESLEYHKAITAINRWVNADFSGFYMEAIKDILYCDSPTGNPRRAAQTVLHQIFIQMQAMLGPFTPLLVEETWAHCPEQIRQQSEHPLRRVWPSPPEEWHDLDLAQRELPVIVAINSAVKTAQEKARGEKKMGSSLESDVLLLLDQDRPLSDLPSTQSLQDILVVSGVNIITDHRVVEAPDAASADANGPPARLGPGQALQLLKGLTGEMRHWAYAEDIVLSSGKRIGLAVVMQPGKAKCPRCWRYVAEPSHPKTPSESEEEDSHEHLCRRCEAVVAGAGG